MFWLLLIFFLFVTAIAAFVIIARKGRELRTAHVLPDETTAALLEDANGKQHCVSPDTQFYLGTHAENDIVLPDAPREYAVCIFYHRKRFAFQTLSNSRGIRVNDDEVMAGYLSNGDVLEIAGEKFTFRCLPPMSKGQ